MSKLSVDTMFAKKGAVCPLTGSPFKTAEDLLAAFDRPEELFIVTYGPGCQSVGHKRDFDYIENRRILTDQLIAKTGKLFGQLSPADVKWVAGQLDRITLESN